MGAQVVAERDQVHASGPSFAPAAAGAGIELYWLPLGAGGWFVKLNGRIWEAIQARRGHRRPLDLYHTALVVWVPEGRFVVENCWPSPTPTAHPVACWWKPGGQPAAGALAGVLLRGAVLAGGGDRRRRRGGGQPPVPQRRPSGGPSPAGAGRVPAGPGVGSG